MMLICAQWDEETSDREALVRLRVGERLERMRRSGLCCCVLCVVMEWGG